MIKKTLLLLLIFSLMFASFSAKIRARDARPTDDEPIYIPPGY